MLTPGKNIKIDWKKILAVVLGLVVLVGIVYLALWLKPEAKPGGIEMGIQNGTSTKSISGMSGGLQGTFEVTGYIVIKDWPLDWDVFDYNSSICGLGGGQCDSIKYAYFRIIDTINPKVFDFIKNMEGNSFVSDNSIGLGCYYESEKRIYSINKADSGNFNNVILGSDFDKLKSSNPDKLVKVRMKQEILSEGGDAPTCYSHFRNFELISSEVDTSGWKTYRNEKYGFEIKYPSSLKNPEEEYFVVDAILQPIGLIINIDKQTDVFRGWLQGDTSVKSIKIKGQDARLMISSDPRSYKGLLIKYPKPLRSGELFRNYLWLIFYSGTKTQDIETSLGTLEFFSVPDQNWTVYSNAKHNYEIQYPLDWFVSDQDVTGISVNSVSKENFDISEQLLNDQHHFRVYVLENKNPERLSIDQWVEQIRKAGFDKFGYYLYDEVEPLMIANRKAIGFKPVEGIDFKTTRYISEGPDIYTFQYDTSGFNETAINEQILSTFKFIEQK